MTTKGSPPTGASPPQADTAEHDAAQEHIRLLLEMFPETTYVAAAIDEDGAPYYVQAGDDVTGEEVIATGARTMIGQRTPKYEGRRNAWRLDWDLRAAAADLGIMSFAGRTHRAAARPSRRRESHRSRQGHRRVGARRVRRSASSDDGPAEPAPALGRPDSSPRARRAAR